MTADELIQRIGRAKAAIDNGFSRVGAGLAKDDPVGPALFGGAGRIVRSANAVVLLCKNSHAEEARPILRRMAAAALLMRWLAAAKEIGSEPFDLDGFWMDSGWKDRMARAGVSDTARRFFEGALSERFAAFSPAWASGLPWAHAFADALQPHARAEEMLSVADRAMTEALKALALRWPDAFL